MFLTFLSVCLASKIIFQNTTSFDTEYMSNFNYTFNAEINNITYNISLYNNYKNVFSAEMTFIKFGLAVDNISGILTVDNTSCGDINCPGYLVTSLYRWIKFLSIGPSNVSYTIVIDYNEPDPITLLPLYILIGVISSVGIILCVFGVMNYRKSTSEIEY